MTESIKKLELAITDYCNLQCALCSQGTPFQKNKRTMSLDELEHMSRLIRPFEFEVIKISGGEPTLHPNFREICRTLRTWFPANRYEMSTNGFKLAKYLDCIDVFDAIFLSRYPGKNDAIVDQFERLKVPNVKCGVKKDYERMEDVHAESNLGKENVYANCQFRDYRKVVQDRIYPCCVIFGQSIRQNIDVNEISVTFDGSWRENLMTFDIEEHCKRCFVDVAVDKTCGSTSESALDAVGNYSVDKAEDVFPNAAAKPVLYESAALVEHIFDKKFREKIHGVLAGPSMCMPDSRQVRQGDAEFDEFAHRLREKWREVPSTRKGRTFSSDMLDWSDAKLLTFWEECRKQIDHPEMRCWQYYEDDFSKAEIADVGPGLGFDGIYLAERGAHITFVDVAEDNLKLLRRICQIRGIDADYYYIDNFFEFHFKRKFDLIVAMGSLHHTPFEYMKDQVRAMMRFLKVNGRVLMLTYPKERFIASGAKDFAEFGRITDGERTPWAEWYDDGKVKRLFGPDFRLNWSKNFGKKNIDFNWFDLTRIAENGRPAHTSVPNPDEPAYQPYLSVVVTSRNDDHGGNTLHRTQVFVSGLIEQCKRYGLDAELVFVEWNPTADRQRLYDVLQWPDDLGPLTVRFIEVPPDVHHGIGNSDKFPLFQMIAKNVGIRRARGRFVLATNIDILFSNELMEFLASRQLDENCFYRIDRHDVGATHIPSDLGIDDQIDFCRNQLVRIHSMHGTKSIAEIGADHIAYGPGDTKLHTHACGDFTLMARQHWHAFRAYPQLPLWSIYVDGLLLHMAYVGGLRQVVLGEPMRIYHIEHETGYDVIGDTMKERPSLDYVRDYKAWCQRMIEKHRPVTNNDKDWGYAEMEFEEHVLAGRWKEKHGPAETAETNVDRFQRWIDVFAAAQNRVYYRDQTAKSLDSLFNLVRQSRPTKIVELGTLSGMSLRTWLEADKDAEIIAVDLSFKSLHESRRILPVDLSRVTLIEQDILKTDFSRLWSAHDKVLFYVDAHDLPNAPIMQHLLDHAAPSLPVGSIVVIDDLWHSPEPVSPESISRLADKVIIEKVDPLQCFEGWVAPYWKGGFWIGFREVVPLMAWVNRNRIELLFDPEDKAACFVHTGTSRADPAFNEADFRKYCRTFSYNPVGHVTVLEQNDSDGARRAQELCARGAELFAARQTAAALNCFEQALRLTPNIRGALYAQAVCHAVLGDLNAARIALDLIPDAFSDRRRRMLREGIRDHLAATERIRRNAAPRPSDQTMTLFSIPKPFRGHIGVIQKNAIRSWTKLEPMPEIILFGTEEGTSEVAAELGLRHVPDVKRNEHGTPLVDDLFNQARKIASHDILTYVNADILLTSDFMPAVNEVRRRFDRFLMIGRRYDLDIVEPIDFNDPEWEQRLRRRISEEGTLHGVRGIDYFAFTKDLWPEIPPFALGRTAWDNWLVYQAFLNHEVIDATECVTIAHQNHPYNHVAGGRKEIWEGGEAQRNQRLAGEVVVVAMGSTDDATWRLTDGGLVRTCLKDYPRQLDDFCRRLIEKQWAAKAPAHRKVFDSVAYLRDVESPAASVVVIAWRLHPDAAKNLHALAEQRDRHFEVIFVDNGASPGEFADLKPYIDTYVRLNRNTGAYLARNAGAAFAKAPILVFIDDDGIVEDRFIQSYLDVFAAYDIIAARGSIWPKDPNAGPYDGHENYGNKPFPYCSCMEGNSAYAASAFYRAGGWDDEIIRGGGGLDLCRRLLEIEPDIRKQIYSPRPILYHDLVREGPGHAQKKRLLDASIERLRRKHFDYDAFQECYRKYLQRDDLLIPKGRGGVAADSAEHLYHNHDLYKYVLSLRNAALENHEGLVLNEKGKALLVGGDAQSAAQAFAAAARKAPSLVAAHNNLGIALWRMGRHADALGSMLTAFRLNPGDRITVLTIVRFYKSMDMIQNARQLLSRYLRANPSDNEMAGELTSLSSQPAGTPEHVV